MLIPALRSFNLRGYLYIRMLILMDQPPLSRSRRASSGTTSSGGLPPRSQGGLGLERGLGLQAVEPLPLGKDTSSGLQLGLLGLGVVAQVNGLGLRMAMNIMRCLRVTGSRLNFHQTDSSYCRHSGTCNGRIPFDRTYMLGGVLDYK